jgi:hypothetical protein
VCTALAESCCSSQRNRRRPHADIVSAFATDIESAFNKWLQWLVDVDKGVEWGGQLRQNGAPVSLLCCRRPAGRVHYRRTMTSDATDTPSLPPDQQASAAHGGASQLWVRGRSWLARADHIIAVGVRDDHEYRQDRRKYTVHVATTARRSSDGDIEPATYTVARTGAVPTLRSTRANRQTRTCRTQPPRDMRPLTLIGRSR